ncbi:MAG: phosphate/phosphite/phosphonate ABC transporter substrate-binding protein [Opitutae bacterium]|nr:phosphate/phosphite/phosphonate ABC transporter substrate-binding protein [Opitutae bacterium]
MLSPKTLQTRGTRALLALLALCGGVLGGCRKAAAPAEDAARGPVYAPTPSAEAKHTVVRFAIHPLHNPSKLMHDYQPLIDYLSANIPGTRFEVEASRDYQEYERKIDRHDPEFLLPNPWQSLEAMKAGYEVIAMAGEPEDFKGLIIVRRDSGIREVADLRGKSLAYPSHTALAACIMPQWFLHTRGLNVNRDITNRYVGSQESAIMNTYLRVTAAGVTWPPPWRAFQSEHPAEAAQLRVMWETESLLNNSVMARKDLPAGLGARVRQLLLELHQKPAGRDILAGIETARFLPATDADYDAVRQFVARFETEVRPVKTPP